MRAEQVVKTALFLIGPPGSGKSTWAQPYLDQGWAHISTDQWVERVAREQKKTYGEVFQAEIKNAERDMQARLDAAISDGRNIVWDQTNMSRKGRRAKVDRLLSAGYNVDAHVFMPTSQELNRRQMKRAVETGKAIPQRVIDMMMDNYEAPIEAEGFASITNHA